MSPQEIKNLAQAEVEAETIRRQIEAEKVRIRERLARPWWRNLFPYRITITRL